MSKLRWHIIKERQMDDEEKEYFKDSGVNTILEDIPEDGEECLLSSGIADVFCNEGIDGCGWEGQDVEDGQKWVSIADILDYLNAEQIKEQSE